MKKNLVLILLPLLAILTLGTLNVTRKIRWRDVTDGVTWKPIAEGLRAGLVDPNSEAFLRAGIRKGDVLTAINKVPVRTKSDVLRSLWQAAATDQSVTYEINKEGMQIYPTFYPQRKAANPIYYYLVLVGAMTLALGLVVFFNSRGLMSLPYVFFYLLALAFSAFMIFSPTGEMTPLDMVFYGLDKISFLAFPPLLLHFFMIFPLRVRFLKAHPGLRVALYTPAGLLGLARLVKPSRAEKLARRSRLYTLFIPHGCRPFVTAETGEVTLKRILLPLDPGTDARPAMIRAVRDPERINVNNH